MAPKAGGPLRLYDGKVARAAFVLFRGDCLEVPRIDTAADEAEVVDLQPHRDGPDECLVRGPVRRRLHGAKAHAAVAVHRRMREP